MSSTSKANSKTRARAKAVDGVQTQVINQNELELRRAKNLARTKRGSEPREKVCKFGIGRKVFTPEQLEERAEQQRQYVRDWRARKKKEGTLPKYARPGHNASKRQADFEAMLETIANTPIGEPSSNIFP